MVNTISSADCDATKEENLKASRSQTTSSVTSLKKKRRQREKRHDIRSQFTIRKPTWAYVHLRHLNVASSNSNEAVAPLDAVTAQLHIVAALTQFLGLHGASIQFDILKLEARDVWIRLTADVETAVLAALGGWTSARGEGWSVRGRSSWDARAVGPDVGQDLFEEP